MAGEKKVFGNKYPPATIGKAGNGISQNNQSFGRVKCKQVNSYDSQQ